MEFACESFDLVITRCRNPLCVQLDMELLEVKETADVVGRNPLCVQLDMESTSGKVRQIRAAGAKTGGSVFFSHVKGHCTDS